MENLCDETIAVLTEHGKTKEDIRWIGCKQFQIPTEDFWRLADVEYDDDYGAVLVAQDLLIVGDDFWLERKEYDGAEWFEYYTMPKKPDVTHQIKYLTVDQYNQNVEFYHERKIGWETLSTLNGLEEKLW